MNLIIPFFLLLLTAMHGYCQSVPNQKTINEQTQAWVSINSNIYLNSRWGILADVHIRNSKLESNPGFVLGRIGALYRLHRHAIFGAGYANLYAEPKPGYTTWTDENRLYQQFQYSSSIGKVTFTQRIRTEQRWRQTLDPKTDQLSGEVSFSNRVRYLVSFTIPVFKNPAAPALVLSDEAMLQFGKDIVYNTFDQNRIFVGIKQSITNSWSYDFGYMRVFQQRNAGFSYDMSHTLRLFFYYSKDKAGINQ